MTSIGRGLYVERLTAGSTAAARKCLLITRKIIIPPPDSRDPPDGPPYFMKKRFPPDCWDPSATSSHARKYVHITGKKMIRPLSVGMHQLHLRTQGSASGQKKTIRPPDCWDPPATSSHARKCVRKKRFAPRLLGPTSYTFARKEVRPGKKTIRPPDCWDPAATPSHARKCVRAKKQNDSPR